MCRLYLPTEPDLAGGRVAPLRIGTATPPARSRVEPPRLPGITGRRRVHVEQTLARTGSIAATMQATGVSYETAHALMEWMAA